MITIALVSPYPELTALGHLAKDSWKQKGVQLDIFEAVGEKAAKQLSIEADAVICRGVTGVALRTVLPEKIPQIELKTTAHDVIRTIQQCKAKPGFPQSFVIIGTKSMIYGFEDMKEMLNIPMQCFLIRNELEGRLRLEEVIKGPPVTVISGSTTVGNALLHNIPAMTILSGEQSLHDAIEEALQVATVALRERAIAKSLRISMNSLAEGIISVDANGKISNINSAAESFLLGTEAADSGSAMDVRFSPSRLLGMPITSFISDSCLEPASTGKESFFLHKMLSGNTLAIYSLPIFLEGRFMGVVCTLHEVHRLHTMESDVRASLKRQGHEARYTFADCVGEAPVFLQIIKKAFKYSAMHAGVLIYGETGTGKEMIAQSMHNASPRARGPFVAVNCAALSETLLESVLFGYVEGAFTGAAKHGKPGLFEMAHGGTIFLDEVSEIPLYLQGRLLRVLQERVIMRLGHDKIIPVDVRVIAATNRNLSELAADNKFRGDLHYRLDVLDLVLPSLRERKADIPLLAAQFFRQFAAKHKRKAVALSEAASARLLLHDWPGNIRELHNVCERLFVLADSPILDVENVLEVMAQHPTGRGSIPAEEKQEATAGQLASPFPVQVSAASAHAQQTPILEQAETQAISHAMHHCGGNRTKAARMLGISRSTLWRKLQNPIP